MVMVGADGTAETVPRQWVRAGIFDVLGIEPVVGRTFQPEDDRQLAHVVVLSEAFWYARFGADPGVIGTDVRLGRRLLHRRRCRAAGGAASGPDQHLGAHGVPATSAWASTLPMGDSVLGDVSFEVVGTPPAADGQRPIADYAVVSASYFPTLDLPIVAGRTFDDHDTLDSAAVSIVNEAFAARYLQGRSPIGARIALRPAGTPESEGRVVEIVGVARQIKRRPDEQEPFIQLYVPLAQRPVDDVYLLVQSSSGPAEALTGSVRAAIGRVDREQLVSVRDFMTLDDIAWGVTGRHRFRAVMVVTFAGLALALAMVGVFGILAYSVQQRAKDLAVRRALGATTGDVLRLVIVSAIKVIGAGIGVGLVLAAALGRLVATMLFGVTPLDPLTFALVTVVLALTAGLAVAGPAWRAARIDPVVELRSA